MRLQRGTDDDWKKEEGRCISQGFQVAIQEKKNLTQNFVQGMDSIHKLRTEINFTSG